MHVDLQRLPLTTATAIPAGNNCEKSMLMDVGSLSSLMDVGPTPACLQKSCKDSGMKR